MKNQIAVGGSAANPPHIGHLALLKALLATDRFSKVMWIPSGHRPDKPGFIGPEHRVFMTKLTFNELQQKDKRLLVNLSDVYGENMPTIKWLEILSAQNPTTEIIWYTGIDSVIPLNRFQGKCEIEARWQQGEKLIKNYKFLIIPRAGFPHPSQIQIPLQNFEILDVELPNIASTTIRQLIDNGNPDFQKFVTPDVAEYIEEKKLYQLKGGR
ncbi:nicotinate-nicotinamide nucleotide adenylyltransferase [Patescibacteria group bacterium]